MNKILPVIVVLGVLGALYHKRSKPKVVTAFPSIPTPHRENSGDVFLRPLPSFQQFDPPLNSFPDFRSIPTPPNIKIVYGTGNGVINGNGYQPTNLPQYSANYCFEMYGEDMSEIERCVSRHQ